MSDRVADECQRQLAHRFAGAVELGGSLLEEVESGVLDLASGAPRARASSPLAPRIARVAGLCISMAGCVGCERKAPGPEECVQFADVWLSGARPQPRRVAEADFDELVVRCLTEPFDKELVSCVVSGAPRERCRIDFLRRVEARREERFQ